MAVMMFILVTLLLSTEIEMFKFVSELLWKLETFAFRQAETLRGMHNCANAQHKLFLSLSTSKEGRRRCQQIENTKALSQKILFS